MTTPEPERRSLRDWRPPEPSPASARRERAAKAANTAARLERDRIALGLRRWSDWKAAG